MTPPQSDNDPFWVNDPVILIRPDRLIEFYPSLDMTTNEKINSVIRFLLISGTCTFLIKKKALPLIVMISLITVISVFYYPRADKHMVHKINRNTHVHGFPQFLQFPQSQSHSSTQYQSNISSDECVVPTKNNPFMNVLPGDKKWSEQVNSNICEKGQNSAEKYYSNMFKDVQDMYNRNNSDRQFYSVPNQTTSLSNREDFAQWLYGNKPNCKSGDLSACTGYNA